MDADYNEDGYLVTEDGTEWGFCNACGEEAERDGTCCDEGEIVPYSEAGTL